MCVRERGSVCEREREIESVCVRESFESRSAHGFTLTGHVMTGCTADARW